jgi:hypothetical protein
MYQYYINLLFELQKRTENRGSMIGCIALGGTYVNYIEVLKEEIKYVGTVGNPYLITLRYSPLITRRAIDSIRFASDFSGNC